MKTNVYTTLKLLLSGWFIHPVVMVTNTFDTPAHIRDMDFLFFLNNNVFIDYREQDESYGDQYILEYKPTGCNGDLHAP